MMLAFWWLFLSIILPAAKDLVQFDRCLICESTAGAISTSKFRNIVFPVMPDFSLLKPYNLVRPKTILDTNIFKFWFEK